MFRESVMKRADEEATTAHPLVTESLRIPDEEGAERPEKEEFTSGFGKYENIRIVKNVVVLGVAFMLQFTAFHGTANLQSSVHSASLGTYTLASVYGSLILSNIFLPVIAIR